jgi:hypothetical protein
MEQIFNERMTAELDDEVVVCVLPVIVNQQATSPPQIRHKRYVFIQQIRACHYAGLL